MNQTFYHLFTGFIAFVVTTIIIIGMRPIACKVDLVDHPNDRKHHRGQIPLIGGIAIAIGFCIGILSLNISLSNYRALLAGYLLLIIVGMMDDFNELTPRLRIIAQLIVGMMAVCWGNVVLSHLGHLYSNDAVVYLGYWSIPITIILMIALINANNMLDGLNGLAGGSSFITLSCLLAAAYISHATNDAELLLILLACLLSFLFFNFPMFRYRERLIFLGDAGSTSLGLMLAWFSIKLSQPPYHFLKPAYLAWLFILPIFDLSSVSLRRVMIKRVSPLTADREHIHHFLLNFGLRKSYVTALLTLLSLIGGLLALFMAKYRFSEPYAYGLFILVFFIYFASTTWYWRQHQGKL